MRVAAFLACNALLAGVANGFKWPWENSSTKSASSSATQMSDSAISSWTGVTSSTGDGIGYAPRQTACPEQAIVREASDISKEEKQYVEQRQLVTTEALQKFLSEVSNLTDFNSDSFFGSASRNISIALAFSGGGYRAMLCGAGELLALDNRTTNLTTLGLGGLLQSATYILGLSGGLWLVGTLALNNWLSVSDVMNPKLNIWDLDDTIFNPSGINVFGTVSYYVRLGQAVNAKSDAGYATSITDVWGRALSYQFFNPDTFSNGGENITWSGIQDLSSYKNHQMPFPIVLANGRNPGTYIVNLNSTVFEVTPYELGSWDPSLRSFVNLTFLGTALDDGKSMKQCVTNFDNAGFILGTLSSLFNQVLVRLKLNSGLNWAIKRVLESVLGTFSENEMDIASYEPNPFYNTLYGNLDSITNNQTLHLVDGGEDQQNIPLYPFIQNSRDVDVLFAFDNSGDTHQHWPNGSSLVHTFQRQFGPQGRGTPFPYVPTVEKFLSDGLTTRPVFFGCSANNLTDLVNYHNNTVNATDIPLVVYMPNHRQSYNSNTSTYKMNYDYDEMVGAVTNGFEVLTRGNFSDDAMWNKCVGCAIIRREQERRGLEQSDECKSCFEKYCWAGGLKDTPALTVSMASMQTSKSSVSSASSGSSLALTSNSPVVSGQSTLSSLLTSQGTRTLASTTRANSGERVSCGIFSILTWLSLIMPAFI